MATANRNKKPIIFISYKTGKEDGLSFTANTIRTHLENAGYEVRMDTVALEAGKEWNKQLFDLVTGSDILLLLIANETIGSNWVRREVDIAKGARVTVIPVLIREKFEVKEALEHFDLTYVQYVRVLEGVESEYKTLVRAIEKNKEETFNAQVEWLKEITQTDVQRPHINPFVEEYAVFQPLEGQSCQVVVAGGDLMQFKNIDVFVNSENNYMQMARYFESKTVSSLLRYWGSELDEAQRLVKDTIQDELDANLIGTRPVGIGAVIATSTGWEESALRKNNGARYIFHTATVSVVGDGARKELVFTVDEALIKRCVRKTLEKIAEVDKAGGVISPKTSPQGELQAKLKAEGYKPIESIVFPIFGAGHGGKPAKDIIPSIVRAVKEFLVDKGTDKNFHLKRIYLNAYYQEDAEIYKTVLAEHFRPA